MKGRFVLISGSAGQSCPADKLDVASQFVRGFTGEVLSRGGAVVVLAGDEGSMGGGVTHPGYSTGWQYRRSSVMQIVRPNALALTRGSSCPTKHESPR